MTEEVYKSESMSEAFYMLIEDFGIEIMAYKFSTHERKMEYVKLLENLYEQCVEDNFFWFYCPFNIYESHYTNRLKEFLDTNIDANETDFCIKELKEISNGLRGEKTIAVFGETFSYGDLKGFKFTLGDGHCFHYTIELLEFIGENVSDKLSYSERKKMDFLVEILNKQKYSGNGNNDNAFLEVFVKGGYNIFVGLNEQFKSSDKTPQAKYSFLYHFLQKKEIITGTQLQYMDFLIKNKYVDKLSKIQPMNFKYKDKIEPLLNEYYTS